MKKVWIVGSGLMAKEYVRILDDLCLDYIVIGRGEQAVEEVKKLTNKSVIAGGLQSFLESKPTVPDYAIVTTPVENLFECTKDLIEYNVKNILVEKPAVLDKNELSKLIDLNKIYQAKVSLAYNRRFYSSVMRLIDLAKKDGGIKSCHFEFTEWSHVIMNLDKNKDVMQKWFIGNSTHVVDTVFHMIGKPKELSSFTTGELDWHKSGSIFCGSGVSEKNVLFSYNSNWESAGRWAIEVLTNENRYILKPMEELKIIKRGTVKEVDVTLDDILDKKFKPGLFLQTKQFLEDKLEIHCSIDEFSDYIDTYYKIANYK